MTRSVPSAILNDLEAGCATLARCWKVVRRDGQVFGFTEHDQDIVADGVTFLASSALSASDVEQKLGLGISNFNAVGGFSSGVIEEDDIKAGLWDEAQVTEYYVDWNTPANFFISFSGPTGEWSWSENVFETTLQGASTATEKTLGRSFQRLCDATFGDAHCGVDATSATYRGTATVTSVVNPRRFAVSGVGGYADKFFEFGKLVWQTGANAGETNSVRIHRNVGGSVSVEIWEKPSATVQAGDTAQLTAGCDRRGATCRAKFSNYVNFRGFETMPGDYAAVDYVNADKDPMDGSSRYQF